MFPKYSRLRMWIKYVPLVGYNMDMSRHDLEMIRKWIGHYWGTIWVRFKCIFGIFGHTLVTKTTKYTLNIRSPWWHEPSTACYQLFTMFLNKSKRMFREWHIKQIVRSNTSTTDERAPMRKDTRQLRATIRAGHFTSRPCYGTSYQARRIDSPWNRNYVYSCTSI